MMLSKVSLTNLQTPNRKVKKLFTGQKFGSTKAKGVGITTSLSQLLGLSVDLRKDDEQVSVILKKRPSH